MAVNDVYTTSIEYSSGNLLLRIVQHWLETATIPSNFPEFQVASNVLLRFVQAVQPFWGLRTRAHRALCNRYKVFQRGSGEALAFDSYGTSNSDPVQQHVHAILAVNHVGTNSKAQRSYFKIGGWSEVLCSRGIITVDPGAGIVTTLLQYWSDEFSLAPEGEGGSIRPIYPSLRGVTAGPGGTSYSLPSQVTLRAQMGFLGSRKNLLSEPRNDSADVAPSPVLSEVDYPVGDIVASYPPIEELDAEDFEDVVEGFPIVIE